MVELDIQRESGEPGLPADPDFQAWVQAAAPPSEHRLAVTIRLVDEAEGHAINRQYRGQDKPTNVLSFSAEFDPAVAALLAQQGEALPLGDIVICAPVVAREAAEQGKALRQHWAHLAVHGMLHLLGQDHQRPAEAAAMEAREREILQEFGFDDPYAPR